MGRVSFGVLFFSWCFYFVVWLDELGLGLTIDDWT